MKPYNYNFNNTNYDGPDFNNNTTPSEINNLKEKIKWWVDSFDERLCNQNFAQTKRVDGLIQVIHSLALELKKTQLRVVLLEKARKDKDQFIKVVGDEND